MPDAFDLFDAVEAEAEPLKKTIKGEEFEFPGAATAEASVRFHAATLADPTVDVDFLCVFLLEEMVGEEVIQRLSKLTSIEGIRALAVGLLRHYGLVTTPSKEGKTTSPKAKGRSSKKRSSGTSD